MTILDVQNICSTSELHISQIVFKNKLLYINNVRNSNEWH